MRTWIAYLWERVRGSLWFVPGLMSAFAVLLATNTRMLEGWIPDSNAFQRFLYRGDPDATRLLLSTVAGSMITVAGVTFSVTMVALSLASSQLGPRLLRNFRRDRSNQVVLGAFIATFLFCLISLGLGVDDDAAESMAASIALVMATVSLGLLIYFIHHIAQAMQADHVIDEVARELAPSVEGAFNAEPDDAVDLIEPPDAPVPGTLVKTSKTGYLQSIDFGGLTKAARRWDVRLVVLRRPGHFLFAETGLVKVLDGARVPDELRKKLQRFFIIGGHRTADQDVEYGVQQIVEIALRALSPGINDPFTAITCIDRLSGVLCTIAPLEESSPILRDEDGRPRVQLHPTDFDGIVRAAFDQIRQFSSKVPSVAIRMMESLGALAAMARDADRRASLERQAQQLLEACEGEMLASDFSVLRERYADFQRSRSS